MNFTLPSLKSVIIDIVGIFVIFVLFSMIIHGTPQLIGNAIGAVVWGIIFGIRDSLDPKPQRIFNLFLFGLVEIIVVLGLIFAEHTVSNMTLEVLLGLYAAYRFYDSYKTKP